MATTNQQFKVVRVWPLARHLALASDAIVVGMRFYGADKNAYMCHAVDAAYEADAISEAHHEAYESCWHSVALLASDRNGRRGVPMFLITVLMLEECYPASAAEREALGFYHPEYESLASKDCRVSFGAVFWETFAAEAIKADAEFTLVYSAALKAVHEHYNSVRAKAGLPLVEWKA